MKPLTSLVASAQQMRLALTPIANKDGLVSRLLLRARVYVATSDTYSSWMPAIIDTGATRTRVPESLFAGGSKLCDAREGESVLLTVADGRPVERPSAAGKRPSQMVPTRRVDLSLAECLPGDSLAALAPGDPAARRTVLTSRMNRGPIAPSCWLCPDQLEGITDGSERDRLYTPPSILLGMDFIAYWRLEVDQPRRAFALIIPDSVQAAET